jgi:hypothetical protein
VCSLCLHMVQFSVPLKVAESTITVISVIYLPLHLLTFDNYLYNLPQTFRAWNWNLPGLVCNLVHYGVHLLDNGVHLPHTIITWRFWHKLYDFFKTLQFSNFMFLKNQLFWWRRLKNILENSIFGNGILQFIYYWADMFWSRSWVDIFLTEV